MNVRALQTLLRTTVVGRNIVWLDEADSTNTALRAMLPGAVEGTVVGADAQTAGRGRFGRQWLSAPGANLTFSVLLQPALPEDRIPLLTFTASLAVAAAMELYPGVQPALRWPNDVYIGGRKVCGILAERTGGSVILGIGVNVNQREFPPEAAMATSLALECGADCDRGRLLHILLRELDDQYRRSLDDGFAGVLADWRARCTMLGAGVTVRAGSEDTNGTVVAIGDDGALVVNLPDGGERKFYAGDATLHRG